jgi:hypothetical protein
VLLFTVMDDMYTTDAVVYGDIDLFKLDFKTFIPKSMHYRRISVASLPLLWLSACSVKFSFLALFKRLIRQMPGMTKYWWFTVAFNVAITGYGASVYVLACPYLTEEKLFDASKWHACLLHA